MRPRFSNLKDVIEYHAKTCSGKMALAFREKQYTYRQIYAAINSVGATLCFYQHGKGERIGIILPNSDFFVLALFAIFSIDSTAVLLNFVLHSKEIMVAAKNLKVSALFLTSSQYAKLQNAQIEKQIPTLNTLFVWDEQQNRLSVIKLKLATVPIPSSSEFEHKDEDWDATSDAVIICTSGTTGVSKGVVLTHRNLLSNALTAIEILGIDKQDRALVAMSLCHSYALTLQLLTHLICGAYIRIIPKPLFPDIINRTIDLDQITTFSGVTYLFNGMLERGAGSRYPMKSLRMTTSGAVFMSETIRRHWLKTFAWVDFYATYGLSEASPLVAVLPKELAHIKPISVGRVIPGVKYKIREIDGQDNCSGELLIRGPNVMKGYYENAKATSRVIDNEGWLHTGDLVDVDNDGDITIIGRLQEMINRGGENVYPGQIEAVIANLPGVREVAVVGIPDDELGERVLAAVIAKDSKISERDIINTCHKNIAPFKVPEKVIFLRQFDKTHTGKIKKSSIIELYLKKNRKKSNSMSKSNEEIVED